MQRRGESGDQSQPSYHGQPGRPDESGPIRSRSGSQAPQYGQQGPYPGQQQDPNGQDQVYGQQAPQYGQQVPQYGQQAQVPQYARQPYQAPQPPKKKTGRKIAGFGCLGIVAIVVIAIIATAASGAKSGSGATSAAAPTAVATTAAVGAAAAAPATTKTTAAAAAASKAAAAVPQQVVFSCTGSAPDGVDITYGAEGTNDSGSSLPFTVTVSLDSSAQYYNVTAQLQGDGQVSCSTVVDWDGQSVKQSGSAEGGYNIASAEVCSDFSGGWQTC
jgi:hypothetical protein